MRRYSTRVIGNCVGDGGGGGADDGALPSHNRRTPDHPPYSEVSPSISFNLTYCISFSIFSISADEGSLLRQIN
ncbi:hypothetical protein KFK09_009978 [Dendrobium nobile]|uniref:Uncharacterized protein n=1 Tax=Dendrobium nobile TaxID=94219 RepID=A0A8T3BP43_DENNO|nr:hypothetical protein KFK09_009978 [Dendrobium nobile]